MDVTTYNANIKRIGLLITLTAAAMAAGGILGYAKYLQEIPESSTSMVANQPKAKDVHLAAIVPHHDVVADIRYAMLEELSYTFEPETIILVGPDHFSGSSSPVATTSREWVTHNGEQTTSPGINLINELVEALPFVTQNDAVFSEEHSIKNILNDIATLWPEAKIVPLVIREDATASDMAALALQIEKLCTDCGMIASVDMSHYQPAALADIHDMRTLRALANRDVIDLQGAEVDSAASLRLLIEWADLIGATQFALFDHTNSGVVDGAAPTAETTSHIFGYYAPIDYVIEPSKELVGLTDTVTFSFAGDMMLGREIGYQFQDNNFTDLISNFGNRVFWGTDIAWANLEGPVSDVTVQQSRVSENLVFLFSKEAVLALTQLKLNIVGLANNHTQNNGTAGLRTTERVLEEAGLRWHGNPLEVNEDSIERYTQGSTTVSLIAVHVLNDAYTTGVEKIISQEHEAGNVVIVLPHWGNEYQTTHSRNQEQYAQAWANAGADMVIGMHPHVVQDAQILNTEDGRETLVIYSLGNFIFDQTFSVETQLGLLVSGFVNEEEIEVRLFPLESIKLKPQLSRDEYHQRIIERICENIADACSVETGIISIRRY